MPETVAGLPVHPLIVHATVVAIPLAAVLVVLAALVPRFRRWAGPLPLLVTAAGFGLYPLTTESGEHLEHQLGRNPLVGWHEQLAEQLLPWLIALSVAAVAVTWLWYRDWTARRAGTSGENRRRTQPVLLAAIVLVAVVAAGGTAFQVARVGHSGAKAAWGTNAAG